MRTVDTIIVGAGTAGLSALREVRRYTDDFLVVNAGHWGTTCAATGCMPSKALIEAANAFHRRHTLAEFGIDGADALAVDVPAVMKRVRALRDGFVEGPASTPRELGERALSGRARLAGPDRITVGGEEIAARAIILAPGSSPVVPDAWRAFGERILTTDSLFEQADLPRRIAVIGMGAIGIELAQAMARLGCEVAGFDAADGLAGIDDPQVLAAFRPLIAREIALHLGADAELEEAGGGAVRVAGAGGSFEADAVLVAMGRRPNVEGLGLDTLGVPLDEKGLPEIEPASSRIGDLPVFLVGDANAYRPLLHEAADEGFIAGRMAAPDDGERLCRRTPMAIVFSSPQVARVGPPLSALDEETIATGSADFSRQARARMAQEAAGIMRIHAERTSGRLVAAEMCMPSAEHLAHLLGLAIESGLTVADVLAMPFYHPVIEEGMRSALRALSKEVSGAGGSDLSSCAEIGHEALD